jgi:hypothetical protein
MPNEETLREACYAPYPVSSSATLDILYRGRQLTVRVPKAGSQPPKKIALAPGTVRERFNHYRLIRLIGFVAAHIVLLGLILNIPLHQYLTPLGCTASLPINYRSILMGRAAPCR